MTTNFIKTLTCLSVLGLALAQSIYAGAQRDIQGPPGSGSFGTRVAALPNGNIVVTDPFFDGPGGSADIGAVFVYRPNGSLLSLLIGATPGDQVGSGGIVVLSNGNFVVRSSNWDNGAVADVGAVTWINGETGRNGTVTAANSLVGSTSTDEIGNVFALANGNYVVASIEWDNGAAVDAGAVTWCNGSSGCVGAVSTANSLVGSTSGNRVGSNGVKALANGNYVVMSQFWDNGAVTDVGAVTWCNGTTGRVGAVSSANSVIGVTNNDQVGLTAAKELVNGNFVFGSPLWDWGVATDAGAVTWCNGSTGCVAGPVTDANSIVGTTAGDQVGLGSSSITPLSNGHYVVKSHLWDNGPSVDAGMVRWCSGTTSVGSVGHSNPLNSLVGLGPGDNVGTSVAALNNGNYVVASPRWDNNLVVDAGAVTWCYGGTARAGFVNSSNSLIGSQNNDEVGAVLTLTLTNGNYVVMSPNWDNGAVADVGAATWVDGLSGLIGVVSIANSLTGSTAGDQIGNGAALTNGNYVVRSRLWDNGTEVDAGAVTWCNGSSATVGSVSVSNSIHGTKSGDKVGSVVYALSNGNYVIASTEWDNLTLTDAGAVTWANGSGPTSFPVSTSNSLVGSTVGDGVGNGAITVLPDGGYIVRSVTWDNGSIADAGAISFGNGGGGTVGPIGANNSIRGTVQSASSSNVFSFNSTNNMLIVGRPSSNIVSIYYPTKPFDYDGDGRSDFSIYRSGPGQWWLNRSNDGSIAYTFGGVAGDRIVPGDFTGDGKTDVALWRPSTADWFIQRSEDASFYAFPFGTSTDIPTPGDFDGDGKSDAAVFRPSTGTWFVLRSLDGAVSVTPFGAAGDVPAVADYDGDGRSDIAIYRPSNGQWWLNRSTAGTIVYTFGISTDKIMPGDYTGDGKADVAFWRPSSGEWFVLRSEDASYFSFPFGISTDIPAAADFDGDGKNDATVFRPSTGTWYARRSSDFGTTIQPYGTSGDLPTPAAFLP